MAERNYLKERQDEEKRRDKELEAVTTFHDFLQGTKPEGVTTRRFKKMNADQAFTVIWFLQEVCHLIPDQYEMCCNCKSIFDSYSGGLYVEKTGKHYCDNCSPEEGG